MGGETQVTGREQVRAILLEPLEPLGLARSIGLNAAAFKKLPAAMAENLSYMSAGSLRILHLTILENLQGPNKDRWPAPAAVYKWARDIEPEPDCETKLVISYLQSRAGPVALQGGYLVELRSDLRKFRRPPSEAAMVYVRERALKNAHRRSVISEREAVGRARADDLAWVKLYWKIHAACVELVNAGEDARAVKAKEQVA